MSDKKRENLREEEHSSDEKETGNLEVGNRTTNLDNTTQVSHNESEITEDNEQQYSAGGTEVMPNDVITVEELSHESLSEGSDESSEYRVTYEFPNDCENVSLSAQACAGSTNSTPSHKFPEMSNYSEYCSVLQVNKNREEKLIEIIDTKPLNKEAPDVAQVAGTSGETERKRKKVPISLKQNKRQKEAESPCKPSIRLPCQTEDTVKVRISDSDSGEFADTEDNVKDSSSSENSEMISVEKDLASNIQQRKKRTESGCSSNLDKSQSSKFVDKIAEETCFASSLKGETIPAFKLSNETKKKFELSMETILEAPESSGSDEQIYQPMLSKTNPLKMKTTVGKRKDKCNICNVRLGLCAIKCRCGGYYCAKHRYDKEHNCTFDYKSMGAEEIRKNNPRIVAEKVRKL